MFGQYFAIDALSCYTCESDHILGDITVPEFRDIDCENGLNLDVDEFCEACGMVKLDVHVRQYHFGSWFNVQYVTVVRTCETSWSTEAVCLDVSEIYTKEEIAAIYTSETASQVIVDSYGGHTCVCTDDLCNDHRVNDGELGDTGNSNSTSENEDDETRVNATGSLSCYTCESFHILGDSSVTEFRNIDCENGVNLDVDSFCEVCGMTRMDIHFRTEAPFGGYLNLQSISVLRTCEAKWIGGSCLDISQIVSNQQLAAVLSADLGRDVIVDSYTGHDCVCTDDFCNDHRVNDGELGDSETPALPPADGDDLPSTHMVSTTPSNQEHAEGQTGVGVRVARLNTIGTVIGISLVHLIVQVHY